MLIHKTTNAYLKRENKERGNLESQIYRCAKNAKNKNNNASVKAFLQYGMSRYTKVIKNYMYIRHTSLVGGVYVTKESRILLQVRV